MTHDEFRAQLLVACGLDPEVLIGSHEDAILSTVERKVTHGDGRIEAARQQVERYREMAEVEHGARLEAEAQRDAYATAALTGLSGIVGTPEKGYVADGGPELLAADFRRLRQCTVGLQAANRRLREVAQLALEVFGDEQLSLPLSDADAARFDAILHLTAVLQETKEPTK